MRRRSLLTIGVVLTLAGSGCTPGPSPEPALLNLGADVTYVGQDGCRDCHLGKYDSHRRTGMGRSFFPLTAETAVEDFTGDNEFVVEPLGVHYRMEQRDGKFFQTQFMVDSEGREMLADERQLLWVIGSNNHSRSYAHEVDGKLFQAPACWYPQALRWDLCPGFEVGNENFTREIELKCVHCHNGVMVLEEGETNRFRKPYAHGIGCERCHGPGSLHVERWRGSDESPMGTADPTIVNPRRLPQPQRIHVCVQCHLADSMASDRTRRRERDLNSYRPGMLLTENVVPFRYSEATRQGFSLASQVERLFLSRCYRESEGKIECLTCHDPHVTVYHESRPKDFYRFKCLGCHAEAACTARDADRQATEPADDCIACHMRRAEPYDQRYTEFTDHWIRRDIVEERNDPRTSFEIEPVFPELLDTLDAADRAYYRGKAAVAFTPNAPVEHRRRLWATAEQAFTEAIRQGFDDGDAWFYLGKSLQQQQKFDEAAQVYGEAAQKFPAHRDLAFTLAQLVKARGQSPRALQILEGIVERDPADTEAMVEMAITLAAVFPERTNEALELCDRAIETEPWVALSHLNRGLVLAALGRFDDAADAVTRAATLDPDDVKIWQRYEKVMLAAERPDDAAEARHVLQRLGVEAAP